MMFDAKDQQDFCGVIAGERVTRPASASGSRSFSAVEAATGDTLAGGFADADAEQIGRACELANEAFLQLQHRRDNWKGQLLNAVAAEMDSRRDEILDRCGRETGYVAQRVEGEFARATGQLRLFAQLAERRTWDVRQIDPADPARTPLPRQELRRRMLPVGPVAVFGACNFPLAISVVGNDFVSAIAVGCPVIVKAHPGHPGTCQLLGEIVAKHVQELGLPEGLFSLLHGVAPETSVRLVQSRFIAAVGFTGSPAGGRAIAVALLDRPQPVPLFAELGSTNPVFITAAALDQRLEEIAEGFCGSLRFGNGQLCTKPSILVVPDTHASEFEKAIAGRLADFEPLPVLGPRIAEDFDRGTEKLRGATDVQSVYQGDLGTPGPLHRGPQLFSMSAKVAMEADWLHCETFGPVSTVVRCDDEDEWLSIAKHFTGSLTTTLHAHEQKDASTVNLWLAIAERFAGRIIRDSWPTGMEIGPATHHGGPFPASFDSRSTSVGYASLERFIRPTCYQNWPASALGPDSDWEHATGPISDE